ncbi:inactive hydroxysteroid dehydrogenase-like protein 1 [Ctenocephalides felis]|uniref:inactive hydroxysteroid dehydrogenase-like protein 1 n=1 Tax=Ctenocephalides felis TaxID=7515 RepID=UPI000E6E565B|nr:inactive hydroxysteroid dehydrogenase-like protein 1 [Ctenocephalides felis]
MILVLLAIFGLVALVLWLGETLWSVIQAVRSILAPFFQPQEARTLRERYGDWAVVTGSTDGIGKQYALELARKGLNIVLISRTLEKLTIVANEIESQYPVKTKTIVADFSKGQEIYKHIENELSGIPVGILVNNVGKQYSYPMYLSEVPEQDLWDIVNINVGAVTSMCRMVLKQMQERKKGAIVNVSSGSELQPLPLMTVYAATKVYVKSFTAALRFECADYGLTVQHLAPLFVSTKMNHFSSRISTASLLVPDARTYARHAVATLGRTDSTTGYWSHGIQYTFTSLPPVWLRTLIGGIMNMSFRNEYLQREQKTA